MSAEPLLLPPAPHRMRLRSQFDVDTPNHPVLSAVLLGHAPGCAVVDDRVRPRQALIRSGYGFTFVGRSVEPDFLATALERLRELGPVILIWSKRVRERIAPPSRPEQVVERYEYRRREGPLEVMPAHADRAFRRMDEDLMERCLWKAEIELACGSVKLFLEACEGWCLMAGDEILSEAYAAFRGDTTFEIGVVTPEAHRRHGYAALACARLIESCATDDMATYWSCHRSNQASNRVAAKLGFTDRRAYQFLVYPPGELPCRLAP